MQMLICGSRGITDVERVRRAMNEAWNDMGRPEITRVISGGARGVDSIGAMLARQGGVGVVTVYPDWDQFGRRAGFIRNTRMLEMLSQGDVVVAVWDGKSRGTKHTIDLGTQKGLKVFVA